MQHRASPFEVTALHVKSVVELQPPPGHALAAASPPAPGAGPFASWALVAGGADGGVLALEATLSRPAGRHGAERWNAFRDEMERALAAAEPVVAVRRAP
jgi:hypothetical protein